MTFAYVRRVINWDRMTKPMKVAYVGIWSLAMIGLVVNAL
jgi:hypothetical protein